MFCRNCGQEQIDGVQVCAECGQTLPAVVPEATIVEPPVVDPPVFGTTLAVSGGSSIRSRLHPRNVVEIMDESFKLYREHWKLLIQLGLFVYPPVALALLIFSLVSPMQIHPGNDPAELPGKMRALAAMMVALVPYVLLTTYAFATMVRAVSASYLRKPTILKELLKPNDRIWGYLGAQMIAVLMIVGVLIATIVPTACLCAGAAGVTGHGHGVGLLGMILVVMLLAALAAFVCLSLGIYVMVVGPVAIVEGRGAWGSVKRSFSLIKGFYWKAAGLLALSTLLAGVLSNLIRLPYTAISIMHAVSAPGTPFVPGTGLLTLDSVLVMVSLILVQPLVLLPIMLFYYDLRIRKEGFDLQMLAEQLGYGVVTE